MGLSNNANSGIKYVRVKDGKFILSTEPDVLYDELEGLITGIRFKDEEYNGQTLRKCLFTLIDIEDGTNYQVGFPVDSSYFNTVISFLRNADLTQPLTLCPKIQGYKKEDGTDGERRSVLVKQNGTFLKGYYGKATGNQLPDFKKVKVNGKTMYDKTDALGELERVVNEVLIPTLSKEEIVKPVAETSKTTKKVVEAKEPTAEGGAKLPWDE
jgi:hypothetical protein